MQSLEGIDAGMIGIVVTVIIQTVAIGYFIGSIKTVVERLVRDVESFGKDVKTAIGDLLLAKKDILDINKEVARNSGRIDTLESHIRQGISELVKHRNIK